MNKYELKIDNFCVSYSFDTYRNGAKRSHFNSVTIRAEPAIELEDFPEIRLQAARKVAAMTIQDATLRMDMSEDEAKEMIRDISENYRNMEIALASRKVDGK